MNVWCVSFLISNFFLLFVKYKLYNQAFIFTNIVWYKTINVQHNNIQNNKYIAKK